MNEKGSRSLKTRKAVIELEKAGRKRKEPVWKDLAERLGKSRRSRPVVNLWKLDKIAKSKTGKGKILIVPGKVLGKGTLTEKISISALEFSESAEKAIAEIKGEALDLTELLEKKAKPSNVLIVK